MKKHLLTITGLIAIVFLVAGCSSTDQPTQNPSDQELGRRTANPGLSVRSISSLLYSQLDSNVAAIVPDVNNGADLGSPSLYWNNGYFTNLTANVLTASTTSVGTSTFENLIVENTMTLFPTLASAFNGSSGMITTYATSTTNNSTTTLWSTPTLEEGDRYKIVVWLLGDSATTEHSYDYTYTVSVERRVGDNVQYRATGATTNASGWGSELRSAPLNDFTALDTANQQLNIGAGSAPLGGNEIGWQAYITYIKYKY